MGGQGIRFGKKTGATLKRPKGGRRNITNHYRIRKTEKNIKSAQSYGVISHQFGKQFDDGELGSQEPDNGVEYSLNKRKRWNLSDDLKENILTDRRHNNNSFQVRLVECQVSESSRNGAGCIGVHQSKGEKRCRKPRKTFSNARDLMDSTSCQSNSTTKKINSDDVEEMTNLIPEIQYLVTYPLPANSVSHFKSTKSSKSKIKTKRHRSGYDYEDELCDFEDDFFDEYEENETNEYFDSFLLSAPTIEQFMTTTTLSTTQARKGSGKKYTKDEQNEEKHQCPNMATSSSLYFGKDSKLVVPKVPKIKTKVKSSCQGKKRKHDKEDIHEDALSIYTNIFKNACTPETLLKIFGIDYTEGESLPRKFSINITDFLMDTLRNTYQSNLARKMEFFGHKICVLFITDESNKFDEFFRMRLSLFGIQRLNSSVYLDAFEKSLANSRSYTVIEVINTLKRLLEIHPPQLYSFDSLCLSSKPKIPLKNLSSILNMNVEVMPPRLALKFQVTHRNLTEKESEISLLKISSPEVCGICDGYMLVSKQPAMALRRCQHWFCNECWRLYIESRIQCGDHSILCPGFDCTLPVDDLSLMSVLSADKFFRHKGHSQNQYIESNPEWHWCPKPQCGRVALIKSNAASNVFLSCECGLQSCLDCKEEVHWPATCDQYQEYVRAVKHKHKKNTRLIKKVYVKRCPACHQPMEKNGGCPMMSCRCGKQFCWICLQLTSRCTGCYGNRGASNFEMIKLIAPSVVEMSLLEKARNHYRTVNGLKSRRHFQQTAIDVVYKMFNKRCRTTPMQMICKKTAPPYDVSRLNKLLTLVQEIIPFYFEAKKILEYSCVLLSHSNKRDLVQCTSSLVAKLEDTIKRIEEILKGDRLHHYTLDATESILQKLLASGNTSVKLLVHQTMRFTNNNIE